MLTDWHDKVAKGDGAAPLPEPQLLQAAPQPPAQLPEATITDFGFMDDDEEGCVKVYVALTGDLEGMSKESVDLQVTSRWGDASMMARLRGKTKIHVLGAEKLAHDIIPDECKVKVLAKKGKCILILKKRGDPKLPWEDLRAKVVLPYRRGGGGAPR